MMALLAIFGCHAVGKTTAMRRLIDHLRPSGLPVTVIMADLNREHYWDNDNLVVCKRKCWKDVQSEKEQCYVDAIADDSRIWVTETVRPDVWRHLLRGYQECGGGVRVLYIWAQPETFRQFLIDRNAQNNTEFNVKHWTIQKLQYEGYGRMHNQAVKFLQPHNMPCTFMEVSYDRHEWPIIDGWIWNWVNVPVEEWYR